MKLHGPVNAHSVDTQWGRTANGERSRAFKRACAGGVNVQCVNVQCVNVQCVNVQCVNVQCVVGSRLSSSRITALRGGEDVRGIG